MLDGSWVEAAPLPMLTVYVTWQVASGLRVIILPALVVVLMTRAPVRRLFGEMQ